MEGGGGEEDFVLILLPSSTNATLYLEGSLHSEVKDMTCEI